MAEIVNPVVEVGVIVGMDPATGIVAGIADDGTVAVLEAWDPVQGDVSHFAPAGSAGGGGTRRHLFDRPVEITGTIAATGAGTIGGTLSVGGVGGWAIGALAGVDRIVFGSTDAGMFSLLSAANAYTSIKGLNATFTGTITAGGITSTLAGATSLTLARTGGTAPTTGGLSVFHSQIGYSGGTGADTLFRADWGLAFRVNMQNGTGAIAAYFTNAGHLTPGTDNAYDFGDASSRFRRGYFSGGIVAGSSPAAVGTIRLGNDHVISWRNAANSADFTLRLNSANLFATDAGFTVGGALGVSGAATFTGSAVGIENSAPRLYLYDTNGTVDNRRFDWTVSTNTLDLEARTDAVGFVRVLFSMPHTSGSIQSVGHDPLTDNGFDLGGASKRWRDVHLARKLVVYDSAYFVGNSAQGFRFNNDADTENLFVITNAGEATVRSANAKTSTPTRWAFNVQDTRTAAAGVGGGILLSGYKTGTSAIGHYGGIAGYKTNGTGGDETGGTRLYSAISGVITRMVETTASTVNFDGSVLPQTDNALDVGSGANRWRDVNVGRDLNAGTGALYAQRINLRNAANSANVGLFLKTMHWFGSGVDESPSIASETGLGIKFYTDGSVTLRGQITTTGALNWKFYIGATVTAAASKCFESWNQDTAGNNLFQDFYTEGGSGTLRGTIDYNRAGGVVRYNTTSDGTLKTIIDGGAGAPRQKSTALLAAIRLREWYWNDDETRKLQISPIAQELAEVFPGAVSRGGMITREVDGETVEVYQPWAVDKTAPVWHLVAGWQDHEQRLADLEAFRDRAVARFPELAAA